MITFMAMENMGLVKPVHIIDVVAETADARTFILNMPANPVPVYQAGQYLTLVFQTPFGEKRRSYSMSSAPALGEPLSITVKRIPNGEFSRKLVDYARPGDTLFTSGTGGFFKLPEAPQQPQQLFFIAAGSGITPCFSMIKTALATTTLPVVLLYSNRNAADTIFYTQLLEWEQRYPHRFTIHFLFSSSNNVYHGRLSKWLLTELLGRYVTSAHQAYFYVCGPFSYMQMATIALLSYDVPPGNIKKENFDSTPRLLKPVPPDTDAHTVNILIGNNSHDIMVQYPQTILAGAMANGIELPYSCQAGRCGSCVATCTSGKVWMAYNEVLTDAEVSKGRVLTCQAYPVEGDVQILI